MSFYKTLRYCQKCRGWCEVEGIRYHLKGHCNHKCVKCMHMQEFWIPFFIPRKFIVPVKDGLP